MPEWIMTDGSACVMPEVLGIDERELNDRPSPEELAEFWAYVHHLEMCDAWESDEGGPD